MKRFIALLLAVSMVFSLAACGGSTNNTTNTANADPKQNTAENTNSASAEPSEPVNEDELIDDESWDALNALGHVQTENGIFTASITMPADFVEEDTTQEKLDAEAGKTYISAKLNEDGSVTYKMTKKQHKEMLDGIVEGMEKSLDEMVKGDEFKFTEIKHNKNFTQFDVTISGDELGLAESFATLAFYMYGGVYGIFSGKTAETVTVNYYNSKGELINTADSSKMGS